MTAMLLPAATTSYAAPVAAPAMAHSMPMAHAAPHAQAVPVGPVSLAPPTLLVIALLAAFAVVLVIRLAGTFREGATVAGRLAACCDVAMAAAMGYMLVAFL
jgi:hypothetical protein